MRCMMGMMLAVVGCDVDEESVVALDRAGPPALYELAVSSLIGGQAGRLSTAEVPVGRTVHFALSTRGTGSGPCPPALGGACLGIRAPTYLGSAVADSNGLAVLDIAVPRSVPDGLSVWAQAAVSVPTGSAAMSDVEARVTGGVMCTRIYMPVCGYDGVTYGNDCNAATAGMVVDYQGPC